MAWSRVSRAEGGQGCQPRALREASPPGFPRGAACGRWTAATAAPVLGESGAWAPAMIVFFHFPLDHNAPTQEKSSPPFLAQLRKKENPLILGKGAPLLTGGIGAHPPLQQTPQEFTASGSVREKHV